MGKTFEFKKEIYVSIIAAVLSIIFIEPLIKWIWGGLAWIGNTSYRGFTDAMYQNAALGHRNYVDVMILWYVSSAIIGISVAGILLSVVKEPPSLKKIKIPLKLMRVLTTLFFVSWIIATLVVATSTFIDLQLNTSFQQRITVLAPKISNQEYLELSASWASMQNRADYETIVSRMNDLAQQSNITLPDLLLK